MIDLPEPKAWWHTDFMIPGDCRVRAEYEQPRPNDVPLDARPEWKAAVARWLRSYADSAEQMAAQAREEPANAIEEARWHGSSIVLRARADELEAM